MPCALQKEFISVIQSNSIQVNLASPDRPFLCFSANLYDNSLGTLGVIA